MFLFKVDMENIFYSVSWEYLFYILKRMKSGSKWISQIRVCINNNLVWVIIKGSPSKEFVDERGLRQGDPLLSLIFIIAAEGIVWLMRNALTSSCFFSFSFEENLDFDLTQYVDDTIIMGKVQWDNLWSIKMVLRGFELASGLCVNFNKSKILGFNVSQDFLQDASNFLLCSISQVPFTLLGIPISVNPHRCSTWDQSFRRSATSSIRGKERISRQEVE